MHLDTLAGLEEVKICTAYTIDGKEVGMFPSNIDRLAKVKCRFETLKGFSEEITQARSFDELPKQGQKYIEVVEGILSLPVTIIGVGAGRNQTIFRK
jgi:adenylosuccinate synthase